MTTIAPFTTAKLERIPASKELQAWNAADELLLERLPEVDRKQGGILMVNDAFGALAVALGEAIADWWSDSAMARQALEQNCGFNQVKIPRCIESPDDLQGPYPIVVVHLPKSLALFEWQLSQIIDRLSPDGQIYVLGMVKHLSKGHQKAMERWFNEINPGRAVKKARCVELAKPKRQSTPVQPTRYQAPNGLSLVNHPGSFSEKGLDPGALAFLQYFDQLPVAAPVVDLGSGNGILGLSYLKLHPEARIIGIDESAQAVRSALDSARANNLSGAVTIYHNNGLRNLGLENFSLILCNPPFHQQTSLTTNIAHRMFEEAAQAMAAQGELWVVGNRHLNYHQDLKRWFKSVTPVSRHPKFVVFRCREPLR